MQFSKLIGLLSNFYRYMQDIEFSFTETGDLEKGGCWQSKLSVVYGRRLLTFILSNPMVQFWQSNNTITIDLYECI